MTWGGARQSAGAMREGSPMPQSVEDRIEDLLDELKDDSLSKKDIKKIERKIRFLEARKRISVT
jgi:isopentenyl diphosphate isomerase/L-lactate dehydrogenase-like FMN-dependent dehydrogenase